MDESPSKSRLYDRNFALALSAQACFVISNTLMAHYARWIDFLGGSVRQVGWIMGLGAIFGLLLRPWLGQWINRLGSRTMWLVGVFFFAAASVANLLLTDLGLGIYLLRACLVLGAAIVLTSSLTYITQTTAPERRTEAIGILGAGGFIGMLIGPALGDLLLANERTRGQFGWMFVTAASSCALSTFLLYFLRSPARHESHVLVPPPIRMSDFVTIVRQRWPGLILLVVFSFGVCMTVPFVFVASYVDKDALYIEGVSVVGLYFWCYAGWGLTLRVGLRRLPDRLGTRKVLFAGMSLMSLGMLCFWLVHSGNPWLIIVPACITGAGHGLMFHTMTSLTLQPFPHEVRGTGSALTLLTIDLGTIVGAPILGHLADSASFHWMYTAIGALSLSAAVVYGLSCLHLWLVRQRSTEQEAAPSPLAAEKTPST